MIKQVLVLMLALTTALQCQGAMALAPKGGYETDVKQKQPVATARLGRAAKPQVALRTLVDDRDLFSRKQLARKKTLLKPRLDNEFGERQPLKKRTGAPNMIPGKNSGSLDVTLKGKLYINDIRDTGQFTWRKDMSGNTGGPGSGMSGPSNYLGALDVVADVYEIDTAFCDGNDLITSATVGSDGSYSATFSVSEGCGGVESVELAVRFRLRFCNSETRCIEMIDAAGNTYVGWHPDASESSPLKVSSDITKELDPIAFETKGASDPGDDFLQAALYYSSLVDAARAWHKYGDVPFYYDEYKEVSVKYPASIDVDARTTGTGSIKVQENTSGFTNGNVLFHEYGHVIHMRAWNGTTGDCGDCPGGDYMRNNNDSWSSTEQEYPNTAFAEGWANFAERVTSGTDVCDTSFDSNSSTGVMPSGATTPDEGESYPRNVTKVLCDWYDDTNDNDTNFRGSGDHFHADSLYSVWYNLRKMYNWSSDKSGLSMCSYVKYYLNERKSVANVGQSSHEDYVSTIKDLIYNNGLACGYSAPSGT